ncbi:MAG: hypothetical protein OXM61_07170 [Candidatus Poribacteria bacterium]|nr:hypothetical protein [Candidatus Poribacteria bacterium]
MRGLETMLRCFFCWLHFLLPGIDARAMRRWWHSREKGAMAQPHKPFSSDVHDASQGSESDALSPINAAGAAETKQASNAGSTRPTS